MRNSVVDTLLSRGDLADTPTMHPHDLSNSPKPQASSWRQLDVQLDMIAPAVPDVESSTVRPALGPPGIDTGGQTSAADVDEFYRTNRAQAVRWATALVQCPELGADL